MANKLKRLYKSQKSVFTSRDLALLWGEQNLDNLKSSISYYAGRDELKRLRRGLYVLDKDYDDFELATSIYSPAYISFETVLRQAGVIFQYYESIFVASKWPRELEVGGKKIVFRQLKDDILYNPSGVIQNKNYSIASVERAFLDMLYLYPDYYFDNLENIDWQKCQDLVKIYNNQALVDRLNKYIKDCAN